MPKKSTPKATAHSPENYSIDTVTQKIEEVQQGRSNALELLRDDCIKAHHKDLICDLIKNRKLDSFIALSIMTELSVAQIVTAAKGRELDFRASVKCMHLQSVSITDLDKILRDYPNIECSVIILNDQRQKIGYKVINQRVLSFAPDSSEEDSDEVSSDNEALSPTTLMNPVAAAGATPNTDGYLDHDL